MLPLPPSMMDFGGIQYLIHNLFSFNHLSQKHLLTTSHKYQHKCFWHVHSVALALSLVTTNWGTPNKQRELPSRSTQKNKNKNQQERKQTQYLTRFSNLPTSSGQGGRDIIDSTISYKLLRGFQRDSQGNTKRIQFMGALALIYSQSLRVLRNQNWIRP